MESRGRTIKKIELQERQVKNNKLSSTSIFKIIQNIILKYSYKNIVSHLCKIAEVSRSGYYSYLNSSNKRNLKEEKDLELKHLILKVFNHRGYKKGSRSIKMVLDHEFNRVINRKCIQRIMRKYNIVCPIRKA
ncbi:transposase, partial [Clostridium botulinum]|nr:transposase [Clostridium botulinum]